MKYLWSFYWDCGRQGNVQGLFVATDEEVEAALGKEVYFGEILGKHSEVHGLLERTDVTKTALKPETVAEVSAILSSTWSGYNPLQYLSEGGE